MKRVFFVLLLLALGTVLIMCSGEQKPQAEEAATETVVADTAMVACAGECGMKMAEAKMVAHDMDGETMHFCSEGCKENYLAKQETEAEAPKEN
jgi:YHS domain-containing protein